MKRLIIISAVFVFVCLSFATVHAAQAPAGGGQISAESPADLADDRERRMELEHDQYLFMHGKRYKAVRASLIRQGWKPLITNARYEGVGDREKDEANAREMIEHGFVEVEFCMGTGENFCTFNFKKGKKCLIIGTIGEYVRNESPVLYSRSEWLCKNRKD